MRLEGYTPEGIPHPHIFFDREFSFQQRPHPEFNGIVTRLVRSGNKGVIASLLEVVYPVHGFFILEPEDSAEKIGAKAPFDKGLADKVKSP